MLMLRLLIASSLVVAATPGHAQDHQPSAARAIVGLAFNSGRTNGTTLVPVEPTACISAWLSAGNATIQASEEMRQISEDLTEQNATANWWHWWSVHYANGGGNLPQMNATVQEFSQALNAGKPAYFEILGACWVDYDQRQFSAALGNDTILRNFLVERLGVPQQFAVTQEDRAIRTRLISVELETGIDGPDRFSYLRGDAEVQAQCKAMNGIPASIRTTRFEEMDLTAGRDSDRYFYEMKCEVF